MCLMKITFVRIIYITLEDQTQNHDIHTCSYPEIETNDLGKQTWPNVGFFNCIKKNLDECKHTDIVKCRVFAKANNEKIILLLKMF